MHPGFRDDHPGKGMPDQNRRAILSCKHTLRRSDRIRQCCQRILHSRCIESRRLQSCNHLGPARPVGEEAVHKHDVTGFRFDLCMTGARNKGSSGDSYHGYGAATIHNISPADPSVSASLSVLGLSALCQQETNGTAAYYSLPEVHPSARILTSRNTPCKADMR